MSDYILQHHGIKGQKWGVRRFQNEDGSLTSKGKNRYLRAADKGDRDAADLRKHGYHAEADAVQKVADKNRAKGNAKLEQKKSLSERANERHEAHVRRNKLVNERNREANGYLNDFRKSKTGKDGGTYDKYHKGQRQYAGGLALSLIGGGRVADVFRLAGAANSMSAKIDAKREANQFIKEKYGDQAYKEVKKRDVRTGAIAVASVVGVVGYKMLDKKQD